MSASTVAQGNPSAGENRNRGGRPLGAESAIKIDAEEAMNAIASLDDIVKAALTSKSHAIDRYNDIIRKALRSATNQDVITSAKRARFDAIERYDDVIRKASSARKSLVASIAKRNANGARRAA